MEIESINISKNNLNIKYGDKYNKNATFTLKGQYQINTDGQNCSLNNCHNDLKGYFFGNPYSVQIYRLEKSQLIKDCNNIKSQKLMEIDINCNDYMYDYCGSGSVFSVTKSIKNIVDNKGGLGVVGIYTTYLGANKDGKCTKSNYCFPSIFSIDNNNQQVWSYTAFCPTNQEANKQYQFWLNWNLDD